MHSTGQDLRARSELQLPRSCVLPMSGQQDGAGTGAGLSSLTQPDGPPRPHGKDRAAPAGTQTRFRRELFGVRCILGEQPEGEMFDKSVKLDRRSHETPLWSLVKRSPKKGWEENPHYPSCSRMLRPGLKKSKPGQVRDVVIEGGGGYQYKPSNSFRSHPSPQFFLVI